MSWMATLRRSHERAQNDGYYAQVMHLLGPKLGRICNDNVERVEAANLHAWLGIPKSLCAKLRKRIGGVMRRHGWTNTLLWIDGRPRRVWIRDAGTKGAWGMNVRAPGRPAGSKDAKPRQRRWQKRPDGVPADDWRRVRRLRGEH